MLYLLDTNVCIRFLNGTSTPVKQRLEATKRNDPTRWHGQQSGLW
jgi:predicted nucleic acid-binding protein